MPNREMKTQDLETGRIWKSGVWNESQASVAILGVIPVSALEGSVRSLEGGLVGIASVPNNTKISSTVSENPINLSPILGGIFSSNYPYERITRVARGGDRLLAGRETWREGSAGFTACGVYLDGEDLERR